MLICCITAARDICQFVRLYFLNFLSLSKWLCSRIKYSLKQFISKKGYLLCKIEYIKGCFLDLFDC